MCSFFFSIGFYMIPIKMIWLTDNQCNIGYDNELLIKLPNDMKRFKELTTGKGNNAVVMGRKTFESLDSEPLPNRLNIVLSKDLQFISDYKPNYEKASSIREVLEICEGYGIKELWVIGGAEVYKQFEELASHFYYTLVDTDLLPVRANPLKVVNYFPNLSHTYFYQCINSKETIDGKSVSIEYNTYIRD